jgi:LacI family transcriptional regulator
MVGSQVNQKLLAEKLQMSQSTVSKSLRGHPDINPAKREAVLKLASEMGYRVNARPTGTSGSARTGIDQFIGVLFFDPFGPRGGDQSGTGYLTGLSQAAQERGVSLVVHRFSGPSQQVLVPETQPAALRSGLVNGLILIHQFDEEVVHALAARCPVVTLTHSVFSPCIDHVDADHISAFERLVQHLYGLGHRRIGFVGRSPGVSYSRARYASFVQAMVHHGLELDLNAVFHVSGEAMEPEEIAQRVAAATRGGVTAWVTASDYMGYELYRRLPGLGLRVPEDVSITGFDHVETPMFGCPPLTTTRVPFEEMGVAGLATLLKRIERPGIRAIRQMLDCDLVIGASTGKSGAA